MDINPWLIVLAVIGLIVLIVMLTMIPEMRRYFRMRAM